MKRRNSNRGSEITEERNVKKSKFQCLQGTENGSGLNTNHKNRRSSHRPPEGTSDKSMSHGSEVAATSSDKAPSQSPNSKAYDSKKLGDDFYDVSSEKLANNLLGKVLVRRLVNGTILRGRIVETESYPGGDDKASVTYNGRKTPKTEPLFMKPGTTWVYLTYGMYNCINISSQGAGAAVLLRAVDPLEGFDYMNERRLSNRKTKKVIKLKYHELCNGPSKLCMSFSIDIATCNKIDLCSSEILWIEDDGTYVEPGEIIATTRIGIESVVREWATKPFRFYVYRNNSVSRRDPQKESRKDLKN